jgi:hypothetical protein
MGERLWLLAPGNKGTSDAYRTGFERIWGKRKGDVRHVGDKPLRMGLRVDSRQLEHFSKSPEHTWDV